MNHLPFEMRLTYLVVFLLTLVLLVCLLGIIVFYTRRQVLFQKEKKLKEIEFQNSLLQRELENRKKIHNERQRISEDIHDDIGAGISALRLQTEYIRAKIADDKLTQSMDDLLETCDEINLSMRELLWSLRPENECMYQLVRYIEAYAINFFNKTTIQIHFKKEIRENQFISSVTSRNLFLCMKEAFNNVYKHSSAENLFITFKQTEKDWSIEILDDGVGMCHQKKSGNGLHNMKTRMENCNGNFQILPSEKGCHLRMEFEL